MCCSVAPSGGSVKCGDGNPTAHVYFLLFVLFLTALRPLGLFVPEYWHAYVIRPQSGRLHFNAT